MLNIGERITQLRKQQNLSQDELAKKAEVSRTIIGNYERNANTPSIEVLIKLAKVFNVSVDYIIGEGKLAALDKDLLKRIEDIEKLDEATKQHLFFSLITLYRTIRLRKLLINEKAPKIGAFDAQKIFDIQFSKSVSNFARLKSANLYFVIIGGISEISLSTIIFSLSF